MDADTDGGITALTEYLKTHPEDSQTYYELGVLQFVSAVEHLGQNFYRYGLRTQENGLASMLPFVRLPVPANPDPEVLTYIASRQIFQEFLNDLVQAEKSLAAVSDPDVSLSLQITKFLLDFAPKREDPVSLGEILVRMRTFREPKPLTIVFDRADASWLRGYCHLLSAMCEFLLAYDGQEIYDATAHIFFQKVESPFPFLTQGRRVFEFSQYDIADLIAWIHLIRMSVLEPERMQRARGHLEQVLLLSDEMWQFAVAETDDDHEWIPNAKQTGELGIPVSQEIIDSWRLMTKEGLEILRGERLVPFWRGNGDQGVNLKRVFTEPTTFDLVLWIQGTAAAPYLERGRMTDPDVWFRLQRVLRGDFVVFALWFN